MLHGSLHLVMMMKTAASPLRVPCIAWIEAKWADSDMLWQHDRIQFNRVRLGMYLTFVRQRGESIRYLSLWIHRLCIGCEPMRIIQRAWRRHRERRRLTVCMARDGLLERVIATLCVEDLRRMVV